MKTKLILYSTCAREFADRIKDFKTVSEVALFGSVSAGDQFPQDVDIVVFVASFEDISAIAKIKRQIDSKINALDVFILDKNRTFIGHICPRKECPAQSVDCNVKECGKIQFIQRRNGFDFNPAICFGTPVEILYRSNQKSILLDWQNEILKVLGNKEPVPYPIRESIFLRCRDCDKEFELNPGEQKYFEGQGWDYPKRCRECRDERRQLEIDEVNDSDLIEE